MLTIYARTKTVGQLRGKAVMASAVIYIDDEDVLRFEGHSWIDTGVIGASRLLSDRDIAGVGARSPAAHEWADARARVWFDRARDDVWARAHPLRVAARG